MNKNADPFYMGKWFARIKKTLSISIEFDFVARLVDPVVFFDGRSVVMLVLDACSLMFLDKILDVKHTSEG